MVCYHFFSCLLQAFLDLREVKDKDKTKDRYISSTMLHCARIWKSCMLILSGLSEVQNYLNLWRSLLTEIF